MYVFVLFDSFGEFIQQACASLASLDFGNFSASLDFAWKQFKTFWICFWKFHWTVFLKLSLYISLTLIWKCLWTVIGKIFENVFQKLFEICSKTFKTFSKRFQNVSKHFEIMSKIFKHWGVNNLQLLDQLTVVTTSSTT